MLRPTPGEMLAHVHRELTDQVLPFVPAAPARQLKAALHAIAQVQRTWDLQASYLKADNADLRSTLTALRARTGTAPATHRESADPVPGVQDVDLAAVMRTNDALQAELDEVQQAWRLSRRSDLEVDHMLFELHVRMNERARQAAGLPPAGAED